MGLAKGSTHPTRCTNDLDHWLFAHLFGSLCVWHYGDIITVTVHKTLDAALSVALIKANFVRDRRLVLNALSITVTVHKTPRETSSIWG